MRKKMKRALVITAGILLVAGIVAVISFRVYTARRERTTIVAFYDVDTAYETSVQEVLSRTFSSLPAAVSGEKPPVLEFVTLTDKEAVNPKLPQKIDVLITQTGALTESLMAEAVSENEETAMRFPRSIQQSPCFSLNGQMVVMPLFLNHFESAYYTNLLKDLSSFIPSSLGEYAEYAARAKETVSYPIIVSGADDSVLFAMISALVESVAGADGYYQLVNDLSFIAKKGLSFDRVLTLPLKGDAPEGLIFEDILRVLKKWQEEGLIIGDWYNVKEGTIRLFMEDYHTGIVQMFLSQHRRMPYPMIKYYECSQFPADTSINRALIASSVSYMQFRDNAVTRAFESALSSADEQENLSVSTQLAPATLRGQPADIQADDVRFFAASCAGGPVPELGRAAFASTARRAEFATWIREQVKY